MTQPTAPVAVVIVTWNSSAFIAGCLESVRKLERRPEEIVVIDNASTDGTPAVVREQFPDVRLIEAGGNTGFCRANNLGIGHTTSRSSRC
jgi:GT2 family glycosyltransferase